MTTGEVIRAALLSDPTVVGLIGAKVFASVIPQGTQPPAIVYRVVSDVPENSLTGATATNVKSVRVQIDSYALTPTQADAIGDAVEEVIGNLNSVDVAAWRSVSRSLYDDTTQWHYVSADYFIHRGK